MASLATDTDISEKISTYVHTIPTGIESHKSDRGVVRLTFAFLRHLFLLLVLAVVTSLVHGISYYLLNTDYELFEDYFIYFLYYFYYLIFGTFAFFCYQHNLFAATGHTAGLLLCAFVYLLVDGVGLYVALKKDGSDTETNWENESFFFLTCNELFDCNYFTLFYFYNGFLVPFLSPLLHAALALAWLYLTNWSSSRLTRNVAEASDDSQLAQALMLEELHISSNSPQNLVLSPNVRIVLSEHSKNKLTSHSIRVDIAWHLCLLWFVWSLYGFCIFLLNVEINLFSYPSNPSSSGSSSSSSSWLALFTTNAVILHAFKPVLRYVTGRMDQLRIKYEVLRCNFNLSKRYQMFAMEWFVELVLYLVYSAMYRNLIIYYINLGLSWQQFVPSLVLHLCLQLWQSVGKSSHSWHNVCVGASALLTRVTTALAGGACGACGGCSACVSRGACEWDGLLRVHTDYTQWSVAIAVDSVLQFFVSVVLTLWSMLYCVSVADLNVDWSDAQTRTALCMLATLLAIDLVWFAIASGVFKIRNRVDGKIVAGLFGVYEAVWKRHKIYLLAGWVVSVTFVVPLVF